VSRVPASSCLCHDISALAVIQRAALGQLIREGAKLAPFTAVSLAAYSKPARKHVTAAEAQAALEALLAQTILWRNASATYILDDQDMVEWFLAKQTEGADAARGAMTIRLATEVVILKRYNAPSSVLLDDASGGRWFKSGACNQRNLRLSQTALFY
jgi:hypothetical protein